MTEVKHMPLRDFYWIKETKPINLIAFNETKGQWTYPKKGFIQWKMKNE